MFCWMFREDRASPTDIPHGYALNLSREIKYLENGSCQIKLTVFLIFIDDYLKHRTKCLNIKVHFRPLSFFLFNISSTSN